MPDDTAFGAPDVPDVEFMSCCGLFDVMPFIKRDSTWITAHQIIYKQNFWWGKMKIFEFEL
jgi:hypothetical protein